MFRAWSDSMTAGAELCIVHLPGRESRWHEPPLLEIGEVCRGVGDAIREELDRPFVLFGHSLGGLIAFELGRHLRSSMNAVPKALFVAAHRAPHLRSPRTRIAGRPDAEFLTLLNARHGGVSAPALPHRGLLSLLLQTIKADYGMAESYRYADQTPLACPISVFGGVDDRHVSEQELMAWQQHTSAAFTHRMLPGDHFFVDTMPDRLLSLMLADVDDL